MLIQGKAIVYGDDVSTDLIYPGRYTYALLSPEQIAGHALEDLDPEFAGRDVRGDIIVAGKNWGCGSAREQAVKCLKQKGIGAIVAKSISRIYYRNCINEGLLPIVCPEAASSVENGEAISIDLDKSRITTAKGVYSFPEFPAYVRDILDCGGLIASVKRELAGKND